LNEIAKAHVAVGGTKRGRRYATQQINRAYAVLLASQFQGFCRDLHTECINEIIKFLAPPPVLLPLVLGEFTRNRGLDRGNAQAASIGADFGRLGIRIWEEVDNADPANVERRARLEDLNRWRNAIAHQDLDPAKLGGSVVLRLQSVRQWRSDCDRLAYAFDEAMRRHLQGFTKTSPW
jgi:hypothetical protein